MSENDDLEFLELLRAGTQRHELEHAAQHQVAERPEQEPTPRDQRDGRTTVRPTRVSQTRNRVNAPHSASVTAGRRFPSSRRTSARRELAARWGGGSRPAARRWTGLVDHVRGHFLAAVRGQAMEEDRPWLRKCHQLNIDLVGGEVYRPVTDTALVLPTLGRLERASMRSQRCRRQPHASHIPAEQPRLRYSRPWERSTR